MPGVYPHTPRKRAFEEFAQDENVQTGRNVMSEAATGAASVLSTALIMTATTISEVSGRAAPTLNRTIVHCIHLAQCTKRRVIELFNRVVQRVSSLHLPSRLQSWGKKASIVPSATTHPSPPLTPQPKRISMAIRSVSRLDNHHPTRNVVFRSLRASRHQDYPPITRPIAPNPTSSLPSDFMAHRIHAPQEHTIRKAVNQFPALTRRPWISGWRPTCHKGKNPRPPPSRSPNTRKANFAKLFKDPSAWIKSNPRTSAVPTDWTGFSRKDTSDPIVSHATPAEYSTGETISSHKPIARNLFAETVAKYNTLLARSAVSGTFTAESHTTFATAVDFPSEDESDESYAPSDSSSEESDLDDYEDLTLDEDVAAVEQGLFSPGSQASQSYDIDDAPLQITASHLKILSPQTSKTVVDDRQSLQDDLIDSEDDVKSTTGDLIGSQAQLGNVRVDYEELQNNQDIYEHKAWIKHREVAHAIQPGELEPVFDPSFHEPIMHNDENGLDSYIDPIDAQWQREILPIRPFQDIPTTEKPTPVFPSPTTPHPRATTPTLPTSHDAHESAKSIRRYNLRTRTSKTHEIKEEERIKAEKKRKEQARLREEKRLAKQRAKEEAAAARRAIEEAEKAEWILRGSRDKALNNLVQPVNKEWVTKVQNAMTCPLSSQVAMSVTGQPLSRHAFGTLLPGPNDNSSAWLNDEIVTAYLDLVCAHGNNQYGITQEAIKRKTSKPKYAAFSTQFMTTLRGPRGYSGVARWAGRKQIGKQDMLGCEYVFVPVHVGGNHWTILIISPTRKTVEYFDSFGNDGTVYTSAIMKYLTAELEGYFKEDEWRVWSKAESAVQMNGVDCGVFSVTTAKAVTLGYTPKIAFAQKDMVTQRVRMAAELMNGAFIEAGKGR